MSTTTTLGRLREWGVAMVRENLLLKLFSLFLTLILWLSVREQQAEIEWEFPIAYTLPPRGSLALRDELPQTVTITFYGRSADLDPDRFRNVRFAVSLRSAAVGTNTVNLRAQVARQLDEHGLSNLEVGQVLPGEVNLEFEPVIQQPVRVVPRITGSPAPGWQLSEYRLIPEEAVLRGPESELDDVEEIATIPLDIDGIGQPLIRLEANASLPSEEVTLAEPDGFTLELELEELDEERSFEQIEVALEGDGYSVWPQTVEVRLGGPAPTLYALEDDQLRVYLYPDDHDPEWVENQTTVRLRLEQDVWIRSADASRLEVLEVRPRELTITRPPPPEPEPPGPEPGQPGPGEPGQGQPDRDEPESDDDDAESP